MKKLCSKNSFFCRHFNDLFIFFFICDDYVFDKKNTFVLFDVMIFRRRFEIQKTFCEKYQSICKHNTQKSIFYVNALSRRKSHSITLIIFVYINKKLIKNLTKCVS